MITAGIVLVSVTASSTLLFATTRLQETTEELGAAVESVKLSHEIGTDLLLHVRTDNELIRHRLAVSLRQRLAEVDEFVSSPAERERVAAAAGDVSAYLASDLPGDHAQAYESVLALVETNAADARDAVGRAARLNRTSNLLALAEVVLLLASVVALLWWLQRHVVRPMSALARTMSRFGEGGRDTRAQEAGPAEVIAVARQFNAMADSLEAQRQSQIALLGGVAHDLRGPLSVMNLSVETMRGAPLAPERSEAIATRLARQLTRLERMVNDLLDATRVEAGQLRVEPRPCDLRPVIDEVVEQARATTSSHTVQLELPDAPLVVLGDSLRLEQALHNVIGNAIKYSPKGGLVEVQAKHERDGVIVEVRDHGVGISERDRASLFQPFRRFEATATVPGTGLGLFVSRGIAEAHGGRIDVESEVGRGTLVRLRLPALPDLPNAKDVPRNGARVSS